MSGGMKGWQVKIIPNSGMPKAISTELSKPGKEHCGGKIPPSNPRRKGGKI